MHILGEVAIVLGLEVHFVLRSFLLNGLQSFVMRAFVAAGRPSAVGACFVPYALTCLLWDCRCSGVSVAVILTDPELVPFFF